MTREGDSAVVLYVDDEERVTQQVRERVGDAETTVRVADSVAAAESTLEATAVDCVVTAYVLPDGTGVDLLRRIDETHPKLPTVLFTAEGSESVASAATAAGVSEYIPRHEGRETTAESGASSETTAEGGASSETTAEGGASSETTAEGGADSEETPWDGERDAFEELSRRVETLTEVQRQRDSARRARERFQHTIERTTDAVYAVDTDWRIEYVNERMARRVGRDREVVVGKVLWEEFPGLAGTRLETAYRRAMATGEPTSLEEYLPEPFDYWVRVRVFPDEGGLTVFSQEVTEQIERQHELERDEAILQTVHDAVFVVDQQFCVRYANPAAARTLGEADTSALEGELLGDLVGDRVTPETVAEFAAAVQETLRAPDEPADDETPDGETADDETPDGEPADDGTPDDGKRVETDESGAVGDGGGSAIASSTGDAGPYDRDLRIGVEAADGHRKFDVRLTPFTTDEERRALVVARDVTETAATQAQLERERDALRSVQHVVADPDLGTEDRLRELLAVGCDALDLDIGIVSRIDGTEYEVRAVFAPDADIAVGDTFELGTTYCETVFTDARQAAVTTDADATQGDDSTGATQGDDSTGATRDVSGAAVDDEGVQSAADVVSFADAVESGHDAHPAYREQGLRAYAGVPLIVDGEAYGTVNFSSPEVRDRPFGEADHTFLRLLSELVATELARQREREALERTNRRLESLIDAVPSPVIEVDLDGTVQLWNRAAEEVFGWSSEEVVGGPNPTLPTAERGGFTEDFHRVSDGERIRAREVRRRTKDGDLLDVLLSGTPILGPDGEVQSVLAALENISEQKRLEGRLRALQETARELTVAASVEEVASITVETADTVLDREMTALWRYDEPTETLEPVTETETARAVIGETPQFESGNSLAWDAFENGDVRVYDDLSEVPDLYNPDTPVQSELLVPLGEEGLLVAGSTERQEFTETDVDLFRVLGATVEAALSRTQREAELRRKNERLDEFASVVAHDLRNPLAVADAFLEVAIEADQTEHLPKVADAHDRIERLIDDLLTLARGDSTVEDGDRVEVASVAREAWEYVDTPRATLDVADELGVVTADTSRLSQLFENLFRNAVEHAGDDVTVTVGGLTETDGFYVADDGPGIPPDRRDEVFDHGVSFSDGGTGFGLSIVADTARAHGWSVQATAADDGGARFEFET